MIDTCRPQIAAVVVKLKNAVVYFKESRFQRCVAEVSDHWSVPLRGWINSAMPDDILPIKRMWQSFA